MIPERFALGMIDRGWILRNKIIWYKPNHMPSSVKDRFSNSWEYIYFFSKSKKYYFDLDAVREPWTDKRPADNKRAIDKHPGYLGKYGKGYNAESRDILPGQGIKGQPVGNPSSGKNPGDVFKYNSGAPGQVPHLFQRKGHSGHYANDGTPLFNPLGKNPSDFWTITTQPFPEAHFAVFPEKLVERPIKTTPRWICNKCNKPRVRIVDRELTDTEGWGPANKDHHGNVQGSQSMIREGKGRAGTSVINTTGWTKCDCNAGFHPATILDPFMGSGTTAVVAKKLGRNYVGIELNPKYIEMAEKRIIDAPFKKFMKRKPKPPKGTKRLNEF